jgi:hypothetical protein
VQGVKYSPTLKWLLVLLLPLSLGWKCAIRIDYSTNVQETIVEFLARNYFSVSESDQIMPQTRTFAGRSFSCRILITLVSYRAWERDAIYNHATAEDQVFFVFNGKIYSNYPSWLAGFNFLWYKIMSELGFRMQTPFAIAVIATKSCNAEQLPWHEFSSAEGPKRQKLSIPLGAGGHLVASVKDYKY